MKTKILFTLLFFACRIHYLYGQTNLQIAPETLATPEKNGIWLQPAQNTKAQPIWGFANGIRIGIAPLGGPRGLIRIYTPYLEHDELEKIGLAAPAVSYIMETCRKNGMDVATNITTVSEARDEILRVLKKNR